MTSINSGCTRSLRTRDLFKAVVIVSAFYGVIFLNSIYENGIGQAEVQLKLSSLRATNRTDSPENESSGPNSTSVLKEYESKSMTIDPWRTTPETNDVPKLEPQDYIYGHRQIFDVPIVNEEFKIVFFHMAKVASSEWKRFFIRLDRLPRDKWCKTNNVHLRATNGLKFLDDYSIDEAQRMMTSPEWTRAVFVRHPKPRLLSAFLDKAVMHTQQFVKTSCETFAIKKVGKNETMMWIQKQECVRKHKNFDFFLRNITTTLDNNRHWIPIYPTIDEKWWPWINFVGRMEDLSDHSERLLKRIKSDQDGMSAWERLGKTGWSGNEKSGICNGTKAFLEMEEDAAHATHANEKMLKHYTPELEKFVEEHFAADLNNPYFHYGGSE